MAVADLQASLGATRGRQAGKRIAGSVQSILKRLKWVVMKKKMLSDAGASVCHGLALLFGPPRRRQQRATTFQT
jgi:hypothetical protein